jgi:hypothetical protein
MTAVEDYYHYHRLQQGLEDIRGPLVRFGIGLTTKSPQRRLREAPLPSFYWWVGHARRNGGLQLDVVATEQATHLTVTQPPWASTFPDYRVRFSAIFFVCWSGFGFVRDFERYS